MQGVPEDGKEICSKCEECLYTCLKHGEGGFTLQEEATTSIQHTVKRKKHKHNRNSDGELHAFSIHTIIMSQRFQGAQLM